MIGIYFSGTGNTKYCLENFVALYDRNIEITPLEDTYNIFIDNIRFIVLVVWY